MQPTNREEAEQAIRAEAVRIWSDENFTGDRERARHLAEKQCGFTVDLFPDLPTGQAHYSPLPGELFA